MRFFIGTKYSEAVVAAYWHWVQEDPRRSIEHKDWFVVISPEGSGARVLGVYKDPFEAKAQRPRDGGRIMMVGCEKPMLQSATVSGPLAGRLSMHQAAVLVSPHDPVLAATHVSCLIDTGAESAIQLARQDVVHIWGDSKLPEAPDSDEDADAVADIASIAPNGTKIKGVVLYGWTVRTRFGKPVKPVYMFPNNFSILGAGYIDHGHVLVRHGRQSCICKRWHCVVLLLSAAAVVVAIAIAATVKMLRN